MTQDLACGRVFLKVDTNLGILCRGGDPSNYVVADLLVSWKESSFPGEHDFIIRNVSVSQGMILHIDNDWQDLQTGDRTITVWNLMMMGDCWNWEIHRKINLDDLWAQHGHKVLGLPAPLMPELPVLSKNDPDVLCSVLREDGFSGRTWIIYADLKQLSVLSCVLYINELIVHQRDAIDNEEYNNLLPFVPWLRSDIPRYLNQPQGN
jgi:hypothetical protein